MINNMKILAKPFCKKSVFKKLFKVSKECVFSVKNRLIKQVTSQTNYLQPYIYTIKILD